MIAHLAAQGVGRRKVDEVLDAHEEAMLYMRSRNYSGRRSCLLRPR